MDLLSGNLSTTGYGKRRRRSGAVCRDPIPAESLFRNSGRSEWAVDNSPAAFPSISYNGTAAGLAALLDWCSAFRAFVDRRVCVIPFCVVVPYTAFTAAEFLPRNVAGWNEALPTVQTGQFICHEAILLVCFFHLTTQGKVQDYLTLTFEPWSFQKIFDSRKSETLWNI